MTQGKLVKILGIGAVAGAVLLYAFSGEEEVKPQDASAAAVQKKAVQINAVSTQVSDSDRVNDHIKVIRDAKNNTDRSVNIRRLSRVRPEDYPKAIRYLSGLLIDGTNYEKSAGISTLIDMKTKESLAPIKEAFMFGADIKLRSGIIKTMKKKFPHKHKQIMLEWAQQALNDSFATEYSEAELLRGLSVFAGLNTEGAHDLIDPEVFLKHKSEKVNCKMYAVLAMYKPDHIPVQTITRRLERRINDKEMAASELNMACCLFKAANIKPGQVRLNLDRDIILWGLKHNDPDMRQGFIKLLPNCWQRVDLGARSAILNQLKSLRINDPFDQGYEGIYPVRKEAEQTLAQIQG